jgi:hypothetical protein
VPTIRADELQPGHLVREGTHMMRVAVEPTLHLGYIEVYTADGMRRFRPDAPVFVARVDLDA